MIVRDGTIIGGIHVYGMDTVLHRGSIGYWIAKQHEGQGIMSSALRAFVEHVWSVYPKLVRLELRVLPGNERSERLAEAGGFTSEGRLRSDFRINGRVEDSLLFGMARPR